MAAEKRGKEAHEKCGAGWLKRLLRDATSGQYQQRRADGITFAPFNRRMIHVGLCGWTISATEYFKRFRVLEVQQIFYDPPQEQTLERWRRSAPEQFEFTIKAWQLITHEGASSTYRRMRRPLTPSDRAEAGAFRGSEIVEQGWRTTLRCARLLRATAVVFQCPASFRATDENASRMRRFFEGRERHGLRFLWEPRGPWPEDLVRDLCRSLELVHVVDPFVSESVTPDEIYFRLHGIGGSRHVYTDEELATIQTLVNGKHEPYVMFNNLPRVGDAERFLQRVE